MKIEKVLPFFCVYFLLCIGLAKDSDSQIVYYFDGFQDSSVFLEGKRKGIDFRLAKNKGIPIDAIVMRLMPDSNKVIEVKNYKTNDWITISIPNVDFGGMKQVDFEKLVRQAAFVSSCDQVLTVLKLSDSKPDTRLYFNSKPIGKIGKDGMFYYESKAVCRNSKIVLSGTLAGCKNFEDSFRARNNPHEYTKKVKLKCSSNR